MSEYKNIIKKYFNDKDNKVFVYYDFDETELKKIFEHLEKYEKPDMISIYDNKIIAIEHFQFDSFKSYSKGSDFKWKEAQIERKFDEKAN